ncbi:Rieske (2Fe-2S) protein [Kineococcus sp. NBC_00420]|uniref:QcrA and Rieske domain-containing protein n=1 Tax=unclassified Kineococcus TaxID=2621656 RepID=UPI002E21C4EC
MDDARLPQPVTPGVLSRRKALAVGGGALGVGSLLAACGSDDDAGTTPATTDSSSSSTSSSASATSSGDGALTTVSAVPVGSALLVTAAGGAPVVVAQPTAGEIVAFSGLCTHQGCAVAVMKKELDCPCHGSKFDALTGAVLNGPATDPLTPFKVTVDGDSVVAAT